ncbi:spore-associated protein A [Thermomonospora umbrina]|uniref:Spore-associated protein A n=1 Tax=Thermomonospora umbrina TaxID=111806 RepID=A0A3D9SGD7_9ACTN|nr:spore-associated protein A [Thermomonospora umbrina]REE94747.1 hypothetical protein DFJ69_0102 [Thermomonospora umbrina]
MRTNRTLAAAGAVAVMAVAAVGAAAAPAQAAAYYNGACGAGYTVIDKLDSGQGVTYLTYNNGWNCVVAVTDRPGARQYMKAQIKRSRDSQWIRDEGYYTQYAGPVYVYAPSECIDWGGSVWPDPTVHVWVRWDDHCG